MAYMTVKEIADTLRVSTVTVKRYIQNGTIPAVKVGWQSRVDSEAFEKYLKDTSTQK